MEKTIWLFTNKCDYNEWLSNYTYTSVEEEMFDNWHPDEIFIKVTGEEENMRKLAQDYATNIYGSSGGKSAKNLFNKIWGEQKVADL